MEVQFILMTIAFVIMLIVVIIQKRTIKDLNENYYDLLREGFKDYMGYKKYRRKYKYIIVENNDQNTLNYTADKYHKDGYDFDREKSTDHLLVFVKHEEVKEGEL